MIDSSLSTEARLDLARIAVENEIAATQMLLSIAATHCLVGGSGGPIAGRSDEQVRDAVAHVREHVIELCRLANVFDTERRSASISIEAAVEYRKERGPIA